MDRNGDYFCENLEFQSRFKILNWHLFFENFSVDFLFQRNEIIRPNCCLFQELHINLTVLRKFINLCWAAFIAVLSRMRPAGRGLDSPVLNYCLLQINYICTYMFICFKQRTTSWISLYEYIYRTPARIITSQLKKPIDY